MEDPKNGWLIRWKIRSRDDNLGYSHDLGNLHMNQWDDTISWSENLATYIKCKNCSILCYWCSLGFFSIFIFSPTRLKETNPDSTEDSIPDSNLHFSWLFSNVQQISQVFPSKSAFCSKVSFVLFFYFYFFLSLLLSLCFPVVCMLFIFCFSDVFFIFSCFLLYCFLKKNVFWISTSLGILNHKTSVGKTTNYKLKITSFAGPLLKG